MVLSDNVPCEQFSRVTFPRLPPSAGEFPTRFMTTLPRCLNQGRVLPPAIGGLGALRLAMSCRLQGFWRWNKLVKPEKDGRILSDCGGFSSLFHWNSSKITISCGSSPPSLGWDVILFSTNQKKSEDGAAYLPKFQPLSSRLWKKANLMGPLGFTDPEFQRCFSIYPAETCVSEVPNQIRQ